MNTIQSSNDKGMNAILKGVGLLAEEKIRQSAFDKTLSGIIVGADYETNIYTVRINGYDYHNISSVIKAEINDSVMIMCPQNQLSQMFIYSKIDNTNYLDMTTTYTSNTTVKVIDDMKGVLINSVNLTLQLESGCIYMLYGTTYTKSSGAVTYDSIHLICPSLIDSNTLNTPMKIYGTNTLPYTLTTLTNQSLKITNLGSNYEAHFALKKIF